MSRYWGRSILVVKSAPLFPLRAQAAVVHQRSSETNCRVARVVLVAAHRCARSSRSGDFGYAGPRDAVLRAPAIDCGYAPILGVGPRTESAGGAGGHGRVGGGGRQDSQTKG